MRHRLTVVIRGSDVVSSSGGSATGSQRARGLAKQSGGSSGSPENNIRAVKGVAAFTAIAILGTWIASGAAPPEPRIVVGLLILLLFLWAAYRILKRD